MDLDDFRARYERDGYVKGGRIIIRSEAAELAAELDEIAAAQFGGENSSLGRPYFSMDLGKKDGDHLYQLGNLFEVSARFRALIHNEAMLKQAAFLARTRTLQVWAEQTMSKPPRIGGHLRWHQDAAHHAASITPPTCFIAAWVALDDCDVESGCMWMVPGSHRWGDQEKHLFRWRFEGEVDDFRAVRPPKDLAIAHEEWREPVPIQLSAGEVHFHHPLTWHGSAANRSDRPRRAEAIHYMTDGACLAESADPRVPLRPGRPLVEAHCASFPVVYRLA